MKKKKKLKVKNQVTKRFLKVMPSGMCEAFRVQMATKQTGTKKKKKEKGKRKEKKRMVFLLSMWQKKGPDATESRRGGSVPFTACLV